MLTAAQSGFILRPTSIKAAKVPKPGTLLRIEDVAQALDVDPWTVRRWLAEGRFNWKGKGQMVGAFKIGPSRTHPWRIPQSTLDRFIAERQKERGQSN